MAKHLVQQLETVTKYTTIVTIDGFRACCGSVLTYEAKLCKGNTPLHVLLPCIHIQFKVHALQSEDVAMHVWVCVYMNTFVLYTAVNVCACVCVCVFVCVHVCVCVFSIRIYKSVLY